MDVHLILRRDGRDGPEVLIWRGRPGRNRIVIGPADVRGTLTDAEESRLVIDTALDAVSGVAFGVAHGDPELVERGRRTLARLRTEHRSCNSPTGESQ
ncbi:hypothetical protein [Streptomyces sp. NPDC056255]|uniref:hypothetical protein n=1 Tax=Streptomyces sp. NPDC056255 TaxID=3345764 RepID=UPI0035E2596B